MIKLKSNQRICKYCKTEIPPNGKVTCPNCKKVNNQPFTKRPYFGIIIVILLILFVMLVFGKLGPTNHKTNDIENKIDLTQPNPEYTEREDAVIDSADSDSNENTVFIPDQESRTINKSSTSVNEVFATSVENIVKSSDIASNLELTKFKDNDTDTIIILFDVKNKNDDTTKIVNTILDATKDANITDKVLIGISSNDSITEQNIKGYIYVATIDKDHNLLQNYSDKSVNLFYA